MNITKKPFISDPFPQEYIESAKVLLANTVGLVSESPASRLLAQSMFEKYPRMGQLANDAAAKTGCDPVDVMMANLSYDLLFGLIGCSTVVLSTNEGPLVARNMDWFPTGLIARASALVPVNDGVSAGTAGMFGVVTAMSNRGFALILNAAYGGPNQYENWPMLLFLREVVDTAQNFDDALAMLTSTKLMTGGIVTLVGTTNEERVVVERAPRHVATRRAAVDEPLFVTNHYRVLAQVGETCERYKWLTANKDKSPMEMLEGVKNNITSQHIIIKPAKREMELFVPTELLDVQEGPVSFQELVQILDFGAGEPDGNS